MSSYITTNISINDNVINSNTFVNELLIDYYDRNKFTFYYSKYDDLRKNILNNDFNNCKQLKNNLFYNKNDIFILRKKDNKIIKLPKLINNSNSNFDYSLYIHMIKKKEYSIILNSDNNDNDLSTINSIIYLYNNLI